MSIVRKWVQLPRPERRLLLRALPLVVCVRLGLWVLPWRVTRRVTQRLSGAKRPAAVAAGVMLGRRGVPASLRFGATRDGGGRFVAHAWVESAGRIVIGGATSPQRYSVFPTPNGATIDRAAAAADSSGITV